MHRSRWCRPRARSRDGQPGGDEVTNCSDSISGSGGPSRRATAADAPDRPAAHAPAVGGHTARQSGRNTASSQSPIGRRASGLRPTPGRSARRSGPTAARSAGRRGCTPPAPGRRVVRPGGPPSARPSIVRRPIPPEPVGRHPGPEGSSGEIRRRPTMQAAGEGGQQPAPDRVPEPGRSSQPVAASSPPLGWKNGTLMSGLSSPLEPGEHAAVGHVVGQ